MTNPWPRFRIFAVRDGQTYVLLVRRRRSEHEPEEANYFWLQAESGLTVTPEIAEACEKRYHMLSDSKCNRDFIYLMVKYAEAVVQTGKLKMGVQVIGPYQSGEECGRIIHHFFERGDVKLAAFFRGARAFKERVLARVAGKDDLVGRAEEFRVLSPHDVVAIGPGYFKSIAHVLRVGYGKPEWFRKSGPIAADFDGGMICPRQELNDGLKRLVTENSFSLLEGEPATGKTVLVRQLGYELARDDAMAVYWFDGDLERGFDRDQLVKQINGIRGVFILENIHLETPKYQRIYYLVNQNPNRHVLFTARSFFRESEKKKDWLLSELKHITLDPFDQVDKIIDHFASSHRKVLWPEEIRESIKEVSKKSFWLLAYALKGYVNVEGKGEPIGWIEEGVVEDLEELEKLGRVFPEILVALSPLYQKEVLTEEVYLTKNLRFNLNAIQKLVKRGEVTRHKTKDGYVFYGLPHSALAGAYWEYGKDYRRRRGLPDYEDFVCDYAKSDVPNGLEAIIYAEPETRDALLARIHSDGSIVSILERELSMHAIASWASELNTSVDHHFVKKDEILGALARRINTCDDLGSAAECIDHICVNDLEAGQRLWATLDHSKLAQRLATTEELHGVHNFMERLNWRDINMTSKLCEVLDVLALADRMVRSKYVEYAYSCIAAIFLANETKARELLHHLDLEGLAAKLNTTEHVREVLFGVFHLLQADKDTGLMLWELLDHEAIAKRLFQNEPAKEIASLIWVLNRFSNKVGKKLCELLSLQLLEKNKFSRPENICDLAYCIDAIGSVNRKVGRGVWKLLDVRRLAEIVSSEQDVFEVGDLVERIGRSNPQVGRKLCKALNVKLLQERLNRTEELYCIAHCIERITSANVELARELCEGLDHQILQERLSQPDDIWETGLCIDAISSAKPELARELCEGLNLQLLQKEITESNNWCDIGSCIAAISLAHPKVGRDLWRFLDVQGLSNTLNHDGDAFYIGDYVTNISKANQEVGQKLCGFLDLSMLAKGLCRAEDFVYVAETIEAIYRANEDVGRSLCDSLDTHELAKKLSLAEGARIDGVANCIDAVREANPAVARELCRCLDIERLAEGMRLQRPKARLERWISAITEANPDVGYRLRELSNGK